MASNQGNFDSAANTPLWAAGVVNKEPSSTEAQRLYGNTTSNVYIAGATVGVFAVDENEASVAGTPGTGWVLRTEGSGGRAGRVTQEVLTIVSAFRSDGSDDAVYADASITLSSQPISRTLVANTANANSTTFSVTVGAVQPTNATVTYQWSYNTADGSVGWTALNNGSGQIANTTFSGNTSATLTVTPADTTANTYVFRVVATATPPSGTAVTATSSNASITIL
jgi:hypothetical protein